jgi:two-component system, NarL family, response regulator DevR
MTALAAPPVRLLLIDDSPLIRAGLRAVLEDQPAVTIVGEAGTAAEGLAAVVLLQPDVVLLDLRLPDKPGFAACREILQQRPKTRVIILTSATEERNVHEAIAVGAHGYLLKENDGATLVAAIVRVAAGHSVLDPSLADQMLNLMKHGVAPADPLTLLSPQECRVLSYIAGGLTNKEIAGRMGLAEKTVKNYLRTIFEKLRVSRRSQAASLYIRNSHPLPAPLGPNSRPL